MTVATGLKVQCLTNVCVYFTGYDVVSVCVHHLLPAIFTPALKSELKRRGIARNFYDDTDLQALVNLCSRRLQKRFETRDIHFLCLYLQYCLLQHHAGITPQFNPLQRRWAESCLEFQVAQEIGRHWQRRALQPVPPDEPLFMALLFHVAGSRSTAGCASARQTIASVYRTSGKPFS